MLFNVKIILEDYKLLDVTENKNKVEIFFIFGTNNYLIFGKITKIWYLSNWLIDLVRFKHDVTLTETISWMWALNHSQPHALALTMGLRL